MYPSGLDAGDRKALDAKFKPTDAPPCQFDKEDLRFVLKGRNHQSLARCFVTILSNF